MVELRLPNITASTEKEQIKQIQDYLFQIVRQINLNFTESESNAQIKETTGTTNTYVTKNELRTERGVWNAYVNDDGEGAEFTGIGTYTKVGRLVFIELAGKYKPSNLNEPIMIFDKHFYEEGKTAKTCLPFPLMKGTKAFGSVVTDLQFFTNESKTECCTDVVVEIGETDPTSSSGIACISFNGWYNGDNYHSVKCNQVKTRIGEAADFHLSAVYQTE